MDSVELYADERKFDENILKHFEECQVHLHPYNAIYEDVKISSGGGFNSSGSTESELCIVSQHSESCPYCKGKKIRKC